MKTVLNNLENELEEMNFDPEREYDLRCEMEQAEMAYIHAKDVYEYYVSHRNDLIEAIKILKEAMENK
jgi:hypothetical protein